VPSFKVTVPHEHPTSLVAEKLRGFAEQVRAEHAQQVTQVVEVWDDHGNLDFSFKAFGFAISGRMEHVERAVKVIGNLPLAAWPFRGMVEQKIVETIEKIIHER
jgi:hypothetical protein